MLALEVLWLQVRTRTAGDSVMWMEKLIQGVLRVLTPLGPRYVRPTFLQRIYLMWIFRNFDALPASVLTSYQRHRIERMCERHGFVSMNVPEHLIDIPVLGTLEQRPSIESGSVPPHRPASSVADSVAPFAADARQR